MFVLQVRSAEAKAVQLTRDGGAAALLAKFGIAPTPTMEGAGTDGRVAEKGGRGKEREGSGGGFTGAKDEL